VIEKKVDYSGYLDLLLDEQGHVESVAIVRSIQARYDPLLLDAARKWTFKPATKDGKPVRFRYTMEIKLTQR
jgi:TonB family protein